MNFLLLGVLFFSTTGFALKNDRFLWKRSFAHGSGSHGGAPILLPRGTVQSTMNSESTVARTPSGSLPPTPRGPGTGNPFNPAADPKQRRTSKSTDQLRTLQSPRPRVEPLHPNIAAAVNKMPKPEGDGIATMPMSPTAVPPGARRNNLFARPVIGSPPRSPRGSPRQSQLNMATLDSPLGTPRSSQRGNLDSTIFDTPLSMQQESSRHGDQSERSSFAFEHPQQSPPSQQRMSTEMTERQGSRTSPGTPRVGNTGSVTSPNVLPVAQPNGQTGPSQSLHSSTTHAPTTVARDSVMTAQGSRGLPSTPENQSRWNGWVDQATRFVGAHSYYGSRHPGALAALCCSAVAGAVTVGGVALSASHIAGHAVAGPLVVGTGITGGVVAQAYGHINEVRNHANDLQLNLEQLLDRGRASSTSFARGTSNAFRAPMRGIAASGRALSSQFRSVSSVPADMHTMASLRRRSTN